MTNAEMAMASDGHGDDFWKGLAHASLMGALGRMVYYALGGKAPSRAVLWLWEIPAAVGLGVMAKGLAVYLGLDPWPEAALIAFVAASGVKALDSAIERIFGGGTKP